MAPPAHVLLVIILLASQCPAAAGLFDWMRRTDDPPPTPPPPPSSLAKDATFEMEDEDEKFMAEGKQLELSPLDSCHYKVVSQLRSNCGGLSEEQLAKMGVLLLNCQAETEGRRTYPCTEEMSIKECTADMDSDTWNAYHIVSNRARSVCYATRQQLFRRRAEQTVNTLVSTAANQLKAMKNLKEGQMELKELTSASLDKLLQGHSALQAHQEKLWEGQDQMEDSLKANLARLSQEKALIASGQELVAQLIQGITRRMENVSERLQMQGSEVQDNHKAIVGDLTDVRNQAQEIYHKIDRSMSEFLQYQDQTTRYYSDLMEKLQRMNGTLGVMLRYLDNMQSRVEERLRMIQGYLGWAGLSLSAMWTLLVHSAYFVLCALLLTFLHCPTFTRVMLLFLVPVNAVAEINQQPALDMSSLTALLLTVSLGHWIVSRLRVFFEGEAAPQPLALREEPSAKHQLSISLPYPPSSTPQRDETDDMFDPDQLGQESIISGDICISTSSRFHRLPLTEPRYTAMTATPDHFSCGAVTPRPRPLSDLIDDIPPRNLGGVFDSVNDSREVNESRSGSPTPSVISNSSVSGRNLCRGTTKTGKVCRKRAVAGQEFCRVHEGAL